LTIITWILQGLLGTMLLMAGTGKVFGSNMHKEAFAKWGYPQWFRGVTGFTEVVAAVLLIIGYWNENMALIGAAMLVAVGIGGVITHIRVKDTLKDSAMIAILGVLALVLLIILILTK